MQTFDLGISPAAPATWKLRVQSPFKPAPCLLQKAPEVRARRCPRSLLCAFVAAHVHWQSVSCGRGEARWGAGGKQISVSNLICPRPLSTQLALVVGCKNDKTSAFHL